MNALRTIIFLLLLAAAQCGKLEFPAYFRFGAATSAYQIEGAWNASDKAESIWDSFTHRQPSLVVDGSSGDVACDSYRLWQTDVQMTKELGLDIYRFSLSWSRLLPNGFSNEVSAAGARYYGDLIDALRAAGVEPMITLYHWDLPQNLQDLGGWTNPLIAEWFEDFARVAFSLYGDRVPHWVTINEPNVVCDVNYNMGLAPGIIDTDAPFICNKNLLLAHARAWRLYDEEFKPKYHGKVSISNHLFWYEPARPEYQDLTDLVMEFGLGRYIHPIYAPEGGWPERLRRYMEESSRADGYPRSRLPELTPDEVQLIKGTYDYFGFNHYTVRDISPATEPGVGGGTWPIHGAWEVRARYSVRPQWQQTQSAWYYYYPESTRLLLRWLRRQYGDQEFVITENGMSTTAGLQDDARLRYYQEQFTQVLLAIHEDGINVTAYTAWSLMDNFEWDDGYTQKYGLYEVDFEDPERKRTPRASAHFFRSVSSSRALEQLYINDKR